MKKKLQGEEKKFVAVKLYKADLEEIVVILNDAFPALEFNDDEFQYESMDEVVERNVDEIKKLTISNALPVAACTQKGSDSHTGKILGSH